jgi:recombination protein RecT
MANAVANRQQNESPRSRMTVDQFVGEILPPQKKDELFRGLPSHIKPAVYERNLHNCLMINPALMLYHPSLVFREVSKAAALGLLLDPALGEAYIIEAYNYKTRAKEPQLRIGYRGMVKLARQSGNVEKIYAREVCQADEFVVDMGTDERIVHRPLIFGARGPVIGYYAVIKFKDGGFDYEPMSTEDVHRIRDRSDGWKAYAEKKISSTPWATDEVEMAKKTVIRRLIKRQSLSAEVSSAIEIEDRAEFPELRAISSPAHVRPLPPPPPSFEDENPASKPDSTQAGADSTGEGPVPSHDRSASPVPEDQHVDEGGAEDQGGTDWNAVYAEYQANLKAATTFEAAEELRDAFNALDQVPREFVQRSMADYERAVDRIEANSAKDEKLKQPEPEPEKKSKRKGAGGKPAANEQAAETQQADPAQSPPAASKKPPAPPTDDDDFPGDKPSAASSDAPQPSAAAPTPHELDMALAAQRDPEAIIRELARQKAKKGTAAFNRWYKTISEEDTKIVDAMPDMEEQIAIAEAADKAAG